ncbi:MAG: hypothetical protein CL760_10675 [Chloroflexi bacterium]|nr:hypothetical protein [Chloroflexota bacterium]|tara:strand:- start:45221 stop:46498 length:1278 start_codon:yes stop_codon:yes gene_type:complete
MDLKTKEECLIILKNLINNYNYQEYNATMSVQYIFREMNERIHRTLKNDEADLKTLFELLYLIKEKQGFIKNDNFKEENIVFIKKEEKVNSVLNNTFNPFIVNVNPASLFESSKRDYLNSLDNIEYLILDLISMKEEVFLYDFLNKNHEYYCFLMFNTNCYKKLKISKEQFLTLISKIKDGSLKLELFFSFNCMFFKYLDFNNNSFKILFKKINQTELSKEYDKFKNSKKILDVYNSFFSQYFENLLMIKNNVFLKLKEDKEKIIKNDSVQSKNIHFFLSKVVSFEKIYEYDSHGINISLFFDNFNDSFERMAIGFLENKNNMFKKIKTEKSLKEHFFDLINKKEKIKEPENSSYVKTLIKHLELGRKTKQLEKFDFEKWIINGNILQEEDKIRSFLKKNEHYYDKENNYITEEGYELYLLNQKL